MNARRGTVPVVACLLAGMAAGAAAQEAAFTAEQSAAGQASYRVNCAGCHQPDLRGENEAKPLTGADFIAAWGERSTDQLVDYMRLTMPPAPATPGSLGAEAYVNIAAFVLEANGALPGDTPLTAGAGVRIGAVADGQAPAELLARLRDSTPPGPPGQGPAPLRPTGVTVAGTVPDFEPVTDAMLRNPDPAD